MTPSPSAERDSTLYLRDMVEFCERVIAYTAGHDLPAFLADRMRYDATLRNLELIGEAATHVPMATRDQAPELPWRQVIGTRNRLIHAYLGIEPELVWVIATRSVPSLREQLTALLVRLT
ncbi:MAG TPA: DUF86 domain-containing protein [Rubrivivax sp.]|nr:DUF86 domain-containing protein [Rubrivivax sp.]